MKIDLEQFSALQKASKESFFQQRRIVKQVLSGQTVLCLKCKQPLLLITPEQGVNAGIQCAKGCTDIQLDFV